MIFNVNEDYHKMIIQLQIELEIALFFLLKPFKYIAPIIILLWYGIFAQMYFKCI